MKFFKQVLAIVLGLFITLILIIFLVGISVGIASKESTSVQENSILVIDLDDDVQDFSQKTLISDFAFEDVDYNGLNVIIEAIKHAKTDAKIKGITIKTVSGISGYAQLKELRNAVENFKKSGKFVYAFNQTELLSQKDYYFNTIADSIFIGNGTELQLQGLGANIRYYKDLQEKIGVKMEVFRYGKYKSAVEPYLENQMSEANKEQILARITSLWGKYTQVVAQSRGISKEKVNQIADSLLARTPEKALQLKLIDGIYYKDEYENLLCKAAKTKKISDLNFVSIKDYVSYTSENALGKLDSENKIAVIYADGEIISGVSSEGIVGDKSIIEAVRKARDNEKVKAIVLRINSPGGSALASDLMHREISLAKKKKPVYVSMGNVAASGGYYIACNATRIFANAETVTGSIGVFFTIPNVAELEKRIGITNEQVVTNPYAAGFYRGYHLEEETTEQTQNLINERVENTYKQFVTKVSQGRKMEWEAVHSIAQGRVWTGEQALKNGLVDELATFEQVIAYVVKKHNLKAYSVENYPVFETSFEDLIRRKSPFSFNLKQEIEKEIGKDVYKTIQKLKKIKDQEGMQARLPFDIQWQ